MALNNEDKRDVAKHMGKALANKVAKVTRDKKSYITAPSGRKFEITKPTSRSITYTAKQHEDK